MASFVERCLAADAQHQPYPQFSAEFPAASLADAYQAQVEFVARKTNSHAVAGYKAALTAAAAQQAMGINEPIVGVLFGNGDYAPDSDIVVPGSGLLETEIGFRLARAVSEPTDAASVWALVQSAHFTVELAVPNLAAKPHAIDLAATNSASWGFIPGPPIALADVNIDTLHTRLTSGDQTHFAGVSGEVMGGQAEALAWLVNTCLQLGYPLASGHLLMTGSIGGVAPAVPGTYQALATHANGQELGCINFDLRQQA